MTPPLPVPILFLLGPLTDVCLSDPHVGTSNPVGRGNVIGRDSGGRRTTPKIPRNAPCPCRSGRKHKRCCGAPDA